MKTAMQTWKRVATGVCLIVLAICVLRLWSKSDFCTGWSDHYAARAKEFRSGAVNPALQPDEVKKYLIAADTHDLISRKYAAVASRPWRPYPAYPLITAGEQQMIEERH